MENSAQMIFGLVFWGIIIYWFFFRKKGSNEKSMSDILKNDPVLNKLDKKIAELNNRSGQLSPEAQRIFILYDGTYEQKKIWIEEEKAIKKNKIEKYFELGYINTDEKEIYLNKYINLESETYAARTWNEFLTKLDDSLENDKRRDIRKKQTCVFFRSQVSPQQRVSIGNARGTSSTIT